MAKHSSGIFSKPSGSVGDVTFQRARTRRGSAAASRQKPVPFQPHTTPQDRQREKMAQAMGILNWLPRDLYTPAWNAAKPNRSAHQVLISFLLKRLVYNDPMWNLDLSGDPAPLGPTHSPNTFSSWNWNGHNRAITWSTETPGDHTTSDDILHTLIMPKDNPGDVATTEGSVYDARTPARWRGTEFFFSGAAASSWICLTWWENVAPNGTRWFSPTSALEWTNP